MYPYKMEAEGDVTEEEEARCHGGRDWRDAATSQGRPAALPEVGSGKDRILPLELPEGAQPC